MSTPSTVRRTKNAYTFRVTATGGDSDEKPDPNEWMQNARKDTERRAMQFRKAREVSSGAKEKREPRVPQVITSFKIKPAQVNLQIVRILLLLQTYRVVSSE